MSHSIHNSKMVVIYAFFNRISRKKWLIHTCIIAHCGNKSSVSEMILNKKKHVIKYEYQYCHNFKKYHLKLILSHLPISNIIFHSIPSGHNIRKLNIFQNRKSVLACIIFNPLNGHIYGQTVKILEDSWTPMAVQPAHLLFQCLVIADHRWLMK